MGLQTLPLHQFEHSMPRLRKLPIALSFDTTLTFECPGGLDFRLARSVSPQLVTASLGAIVFFRREV